MGQKCDNGRRGSRDYTREELDLLLRDLRWRKGPKGKESRQLLGAGNSIQFIASKEMVISVINHKS